MPAETALKLTPPPTDEAVRATLDVLNELLDPMLATHVGIRLWDGTRWPDDTPRRTTIALQHEGSLRAMFVPMSEMTMSEAYLRDDYDIEGSIQDVFDFLLSLGVSMGPLQKAKTALGVMRLPRGEKRTVGRAPARLTGKRHSPDRDRQAVAYHYNMPNEFYGLWLDSSMAYSCAYFEREEDDIEAAQRQKYDHICRKLRLKPGQRLLDIGCGWGGLVLHAARHWGVDATGITLGEGQVALAQERIAASGLGDRCRVLLRDYRELEEGEPYDALVSVGMCEHVGEANLPAYFGGAFRLLKAGGAFLNHGITLGLRQNTGRGPSFVDAYVFPDGELLPLPVFLRAAEGAGWDIRDVENLREHYARTLRHWVGRLEERHEQAVGLVDESSYRAWRLYMASSAFGFDIGRIKLYQTLLVKPDDKGRTALPLTRADWYAGS